MKKGDFVIAEHPDTKSSKLKRSYGIVQDVTKAGIVIIKMADGSLIKRKFNSIATFVQPPSNWEELYRQQVIFSKPKHRSMFPTANANQPKHGNH